MWHNPKYADLEPVAGPVENGENLATISRSPAEQLRVTLSEYNGFPFISIRVWTAGADGVWYPAKGKGVSVRIREIVAVGRALARALHMLHGPSRPALTDDRRPAVQGAGQVEDGRRVGRSDHPAGRPVRQAPGGTEFNEFA